jgi:pimeloyl-ACP methyl ester carboxylesterase
LLGLADGGFKSADARRHYLAAYDELGALSRRPDVVHDVPTKFGNVRVYQHGPDRGMPVVLIHGFFLTSAMWWEQVAGLTSDFTVYAMDMLGQPGASIQSKTMFNPADCARSIDAVLEGLGLREVHLVGHSYGGWLATHTAARAPHRLATVTLVDPANTVARLSAKFWRSLALVSSRPRSVRAERAAAWITGHPAPGSSVDMLAGLFVAGFAAFAPPLRTPSPLSLVIVCCVQCIFRSKFFWRATLFTIQGRGFSGYSRWCPRGDITCGPMPHTLCQPRFLTR